MTISMYQVSVPVFSSMLKGLAHVLSKGEAHAAETGIDPASLVSARLIADMHPFSRQIQIATDHAKGAPARLAGTTPPRFEDDETTFAELRTRIEKTREYLKGLRAADIDGSEEKPILLKLGQREMTFTGQQYLLNFAMPNFYFHVTTAYAILRGKGVPLGKSDFFGGR
ncbi:MAG: DUF1993 family protein [Rhizobiaceae bacterium]